MEVAALKATEIARAGVASLGTGVLAGIASYGGAMMFASASTGTAIASLSGVAATNATLAWFGGGALTAGGLGMAGGTLVLGGIVVGPVLAAAGLIMNAKADENLASAEATAARAETAVEKMAVMTDFMKKTASIAENYSDFLVRFRSAFYPVVNEIKYMEQRTRQKQKRMLYDSDDEKIDFNSLTEAEQKKIHQAWLMAQIMCSVLSEPLLTPAGNWLRKHRQLCRTQGMCIRHSHREGTASDAPVKEKEGSSCEKQGRKKSGRSGWCICGQCGLPECTNGNRYGH